MTERAGAVNRYICGRGHVTMTINFCDGTTSYTMECRREGCGKVSYSQLYDVAQIPNPKAAGQTGPRGEPLGIYPTWEWRIPTKYELREFRGATRKAIEEHLRLGGLMCYPVSQETLVRYGWAIRREPVDAIYGAMQLGQMIRADAAKKAAEKTTPAPVVFNGQPGDIILPVPDAKPPGEHTV